MRARVSVSTSDGEKIALHILDMQRFAWRRDRPLDEAGQEQAGMDRRPHASAMTGAGAYASQRKISEEKCMRRAFEIMVKSFIGCAGIVLLASALLVVSGMHDEIHSADAAVVLGNKVNLDGSPSNRLAARLDRAVELYREGLFKNVIVSGGVGREGFDEAAVMKQYLIERGIPQDTIFADSLGITTAATATNVTAMMKDKQWSSVLVVSQYFHVPRCRLALTRAGAGRVYSSHARYFEIRDAYSIPRELVGYLAYLSGMRE